MDHRHYVPILKGKKGEFDALSELTTEKEKMTPLIELLTFTDDDEDGSSKINKQKLDRSIKSLVDGWGKEFPIFVDFFSLLPEQLLKDKVHPLQFVFDELKTKGVKTVPVSGLSRDNEYQKVAKDIVKRDGRGICIRLDREDFNTPSWASKLEFIMRDLQVTPNDVDIIIDLQDIAPKQEAIFELFVSTLLNNFPRINDWRSLVFAATAFPESLSVTEGFLSHQITTTPRTEWLVWRALLNKIGSLGRMPTFGDYAIANPSLVDFDPRFMKMSANIRYTIDTEWLIVKGGSLTRGKGYEQYYDLSEILVKSEKFLGKDFSAGDRYIFECSSRPANTGNATVWRRVGTNHHLVFVEHQIAKALSS